MKKFFCGVVKFFTILTILAALAYTVVLYWAKIVDFVARVKGLLAEKKLCCCHDETDDYADWDE